MKVAQGKPVFEAPHIQRRGGDASSVPEERSSPIVASSDTKIIPEVEFEHVKSRINGSEMEVTAWVTNRSAVDVELDKIVMLGMTTELDRVFSPNEGREMQLYKGKAPTSDSDETAYLQYKQRKNGDYFQSAFVMEFDYDPDGFYTIEEFRSTGPVKDI